MYGLGSRVSGLGSRLLFFLPVVAISIVLALCRALAAVRVVVLSVTFLLILLFLLPWTLL